MADKKRYTWEMLTAGGLLVVFFRTRPEVQDNGIPYLLERSPTAFAFDIAALAAAFGLSVSVIRQKSVRGRFAGFVFLAITFVLLLDWLHLLLNWRARWWG